MRLSHWGTELFTSSVRGFFSLLTAMMPGRELREGGREGGGEGVFFLYLGLEDERGGEESNGFLQITFYCCLAHRCSRDKQNKKLHSAL